MLEKEKESEKPTVIILLATYNGEKYLREQLDSLLAQTYKNIKIFVHDDGSSDDTLKIIKSYILSNPEKINFLEDGVKAGGAKENFFHLIDSVQGGYVFFCDQDDVWDLTKVEKSLALMLLAEENNKNKPILIHTDLSVVDATLNVIDLSLNKRSNLRKSSINKTNALFYNFATGCSMMLNSHLVQLTRQSDYKKDVVMHDWWVLLLCLYNNGILLYLDEPLVKYRQHENNVCGAKKISAFSKFFKYLKNPVKFFVTSKVIYRQSLRFKKIPYFKFIILRIFLK